MKIIFVLLLLSFSKYSFSGNYTNKNCEFSVNFPFVPIVSKLNTDGINSIEQAQYIAENYFLRAECFKFESVKYKSSSIELMLRNFSRKEGLSGAEFNSYDSTHGVVYRGRGSKTVDGIPTIYEFRCTLGASSFMCLTVASPAAIFPTRTLYNFFESIYLNKSQNNEWSRVPNSDSYINFDSIKSGKLSLAWVLDNKINNLRGWRSSKQLLEIDCIDDKFRFIKLVGYSKAMGDGEILFSEANRSKDWNYIVPETMMSAYAKYICMPYEISKN